MSKRKTDPAAEWFRGFFLANFAEAEKLDWREMQAQIEDVLPGRIYANHIPEIIRQWWQSKFRGMIRGFGWVFLDDDNSLVRLEKLPRELYRLQEQRRLMGAMQDVGRLKIDKIKRASEDGVAADTTSLDIVLNDIKKAIDAA